MIQTFDDEEKFNELIKSANIELWDLKQLISQAPAIKAAIDQLVDGFNQVETGLQITEPPQVIPAPNPQPDPSSEE